jgi:hypothetical protein
MDGGALGRELYRLLEKRNRFIVRAHTKRFISSVEWLVSGIGGLAEGDHPQGQ